MRQATGGKALHRDMTPNHAVRARRGGRGIAPTGAPVSVRAVRQRLGISQEELARVTGYSTRSVAAWEGGQALSESARQKLVETERLRASLAQIIPQNQLGNWLREPNPGFEGQTPIQVLERGESDRLWRMIFQIDANVAN